MIYFFIFSSAHILQHLTSFFSKEVRMFKSLALHDRTFSSSKHKGTGLFLIPFLGKTLNNRCYHIQKNWCFHDRQRKKWGSFSNIKQSVRVFSRGAAVLPWLPPAQCSVVQNLHPKLCLQHQSNSMASAEGMRAALFLLRISVIWYLHPFMNGE